MIRHTPIPGLAVLAVAGCVTEEVSRAPFPSEPIRMAPAKSAGLSAAIIPLGSVPYDSRSLPLVSPDGRYVATQTGDSPEWSTILAAADAAIPEMTQVEIYRLDRELGEAVFVFATEPGLLLGRGGDQHGFLVESVRPDGSRWIGYAMWSGGTTTWLAADGNVNAFASLGANGRLAWSRRSQDAEHFDLVIRRDGEEWTVGSQGGDWLLPTWSGDTDGLFAIRLHEGLLELTFVVAETPDTTRESLVRLPLGSQRSARDAYLCMSGQVQMMGSPAPGEAHVLFLHPEAGRMGLWRPASTPGAALLLIPDSISAAIDPAELALVGTARDLNAQRLSNLKDRRVIVPGPQVPRAVARADWPYVLLSPGRNHIGLMAMRLIQ